jgi:hypothetical protein
MGQQSLTCQTDKQFRFDRSAESLEQFLTMITIQFQDVELETIKVLVGGCFFAVLCGLHRDGWLVMAATHPRLPNFLLSNAHGGLGYVGWRTEDCPTDVAKTRSI